MAFLDILGRTVSESGQKSIAKACKFTDSSRLNTLIFEEDRSLGNLYHQTGKIKLAKRIVCIAISIALIIPTADIHASAKNSYDPEKALAYAQENWNVNSEEVKCAEFVSDCLKAGGCSVWSTGATTLQSRLRK